MTTKRGTQGSPPRGVEAQVYDLIFKKGLSVREAARRRQVTPKAIRNVVHKIKKKRSEVPGWGYSPFLKGHSDSDKGRIRLHGEQWVARILYRFPRYVKAVGKVLQVDGYRVVLNKRNIEFYCGLSHWGHTVQEATGKSMEALNKVIAKVENDAGISLVKNRVHNLRRVNAHYAEVRNEIAVDAGRHKIKVYAEDDGKLWFQVDNSWKLNEGEALHPKDAEEDAGRVVGFLQDLRRHEYPPLSELWKITQGMVGTVQKAFAGSFPKEGVGYAAITRLFGDHAEKARFEAMSVERQNQYLGITK